MMWERVVTDTAYQQWHEIWIIPVCDQREHFPDDPNCWCHPKMEWSDGDEDHFPASLLVHNSYDGRELYERDPRLLYLSH